MTSSWHDRFSRYFWLAFFSLIAAHTILDGVMAFPTDWDSLMYHYPMIDDWIRERSLYTPNNAWWWSPGVGELTGLIFAAPFSGDFFVPLGNLIWVAIWIFSTRSACNSVGMRGFWPDLTTLGVLAVHTTIAETDDAGNDIAVAALYFAAYAYWLSLHCRTPCAGVLQTGQERSAFLRLCSYWRRPTFQQFRLGAILGLLAGVKYFAAGLAGNLVIVFCISNFSKFGRRRGCSASLALFAGMILFGGYWYARNWVVSGSPVYPMGLGRSLPDLTYPDPPGIGTTTLFGNANPIRWPLLSEALSQTTGPFHEFVVYGFPIWGLFLPVSVLWLPQLFGTRPDESNSPRHSDSNEANSAAEPSNHSQLGDSSQLSSFKYIIATIPVLAALALVGFLNTPFTVEDQPGTLNHLRWAYTPARFGLCLLSLCAIGTMLAVSRVSAFLDRMLVGDDAESNDIVSNANRFRLLYRQFLQKPIESLVFPVALVAVNVQWKQRIGKLPESKWILEFTLTSLFVFLLLVASRSWISRATTVKRKSIRCGIALLLFWEGLLIAGQFREKDWHLQFSSFYDRHLNGRISVLDRQYPEVQRLSVLELQVYPYFGSRRQRQIMRPRYIESYEWLNEYFEKNNLNFVATHTQSTPMEFDMYRNVPQWMIDHPDRFEPAFRGLNQVLYRIKVSKKER